MAPSLKIVEPKGIAFDGHRAKVKLDRVQTQSGSTFVYETVQVRDAVAGLPILPDGRVVLLYNYRLPVNEQLFEAPAGLIDPGEDPLRAIVREVKEETGYTSQYVEKLGEFYSSPGLLTEKIHLYIVKDLTAGAQELEPAEQGLVVVPMTFSNALDLLAKGDIRDMKTALLLQYAKSHF